MCEVGGVVVVKGGWLAGWVVGWVGCVSSDFFLDLQAILADPTVKDKAKTDAASTVLLIAELGPDGDLNRGDLGQRGFQRKGSLDRRGS